MIKIFKIFILVFYRILLAKPEYFQEAINLFNNKKFKDAKFKFEQEILLTQKVNYRIYIYQRFLMNLIKKLQEENLKL